jgi:biopolymer transport protein ExbD
VSPPTRKIALGLLVGLLVVSAGCSAFQNSSTPSDTLHLVNQDDTDHAVVVEITRGGKLVYSAGRTLDAESDTQLDALNENGEYQVAVTVDGNTTVKTYTFPSDDSATTIGIDNEGKVTIST